MVTRLDVKLCLIDLVKGNRNRNNMDGIRKMMNDTETILITEEDKKVAMAILESSPSISLDETLNDFKLSLNTYCNEFNVDSYVELMKMADESEFTPKICSDILDKFSFIERHQ